MLLFLPLPWPALLLLLRRRPLLLLRWPLLLRLWRRMLCVGCQRAQMLLLYPLYGSQTSALVRLCFTVSSWGGARVGDLLASRYLVGLCSTLRGSLFFAELATLFLFSGAVPPGFGLAAP